MYRKSGLGTALLVAVLALTPAAGQPPSNVDTVDNELIVLLRPGPEHPAAPAAVAAVNSGQTPLPGGLGHGSPFRADLVISEPNRARGAARERLLAEPSRSRARLERTIVLHYPSAAAVSGIMTALAAAPSVEFVERNRPLRFHAAGADVRGLPLRNRLTPFFVFYYSPGPDRASSLFTSSPQRAAAAAIGMDGFPFDTVGPVVPGYPTFPGVSPPQPNQIPRAYVFLFTTPHTPTGQTFDLVPIYRLSKDPGRQAECTGTPDPEAEWSFAYARDADEIMALRAEGYSLRGIEGYLIDASGPLPAGAVELHRLFNVDLQDWVVVPENKIANLPPGYAPRPGFPEIVWAGIDNVDSDGDGVVDGFETILQTNPAVADSDGDGVNDGDEVLGYTGAVPPGGGILGDPLCPITRCHLFLDGFESGGTGQWSSVTP